MVWDRGPIHFVHAPYPVVPEMLLKRLFSNRKHSTYTEKQLIKELGVYVQILNLIHFFIVFLLVSHHFNYCSSVLSFAIVKCE